MSHGKGIACCKCNRQSGVNTKTTNLLFTGTDVRHHDSRHRASTCICDRRPARPDDSHQERLQLGISALAAFGEIWPRASIAKGQVARFAREILLKPDVCVDSTGPEQMPRITTETTNFAQIEYEAPFNNDIWMDNLLQAEEENDPAMCPAFGTIYSLPDAQGV